MAPRGRAGQCKDRGAVRKCLRDGCSAVHRQLDVAGGRPTSRGTDSHRYRSIGVVGDRRGRNRGGGRRRSHGERRGGADTRVARRIGGLGMHRVDTVGQRRGNVRGPTGRSRRCNRKRFGAT